MYTLVLFTPLLSNHTSHTTTLADSKPPTFRETWERRTPSGTSSELHGGHAEGSEWTLHMRRAASQLTNPKLRGFPSVSISCRKNLPLSLKEDANFMILGSKNASLHLAETHNVHFQSCWLCEHSRKDGQGQKQPAPLYRRRTRVCSAPTHNTRAPRSTVSPQTQDSN